MEIVEQSLKTCSDRLYESLDILPISDGQNEIETIASLTTECKTLRELLNKILSTAPATEAEISEIYSRLESTLEKPKDTLLDQIKTLKVCTRKKKIQYRMPFFI